MCKIHKRQLDSYLHDEYGKRQDHDHRSTVFALLTAACVSYEERHPTSTVRSYLSDYKGNGLGHDVAIDYAMIFQQTVTVSYALKLSRTADLNTDVPNKTSDQNLKTSHWY